MTINNMTITRNSDDNFEFYYHKKPGARIRNIDEERVEIVRFVDDAVDVILRLKNKLTSFPGVFHSPNRILFEAANELTTEAET